ncbi:DEAD/DEAH box helicase, partial [Georgenia sp. 10Sc9-8]|nr:DEAD/DEAH box helicase [Georgenia halotolerans]
MTEQNTSGVLDTTASTVPVTTELPADITDAEQTVDLEQQTFADYGVQDAIAQALRDVGITHPFPIQALTLPVALSGHDIIGQAKTGTGKT